MSVLDELREQPEVVRRLVDDPRRYADAVRQLQRADVTHVVVAARGTSDNAARYAQYVWGARNRTTVSLAAPSLVTTDGAAPDLRGAAVVALSQSGASPDLVAVLRAARAQRRPAIAITNTPASPLADAADVVVPLDAGDERAVAATKTYTAQLVAVAAISEALAGRPLTALSALPAAVGAALGAPEVTAAAARLADADRCVVLGRGYHLATAHEWALKLQELTGIVAQPWSTAEVAHGPVAAVSPAVPVLAVVVRGRFESAVADRLRQLRAERDGDLTVVTDLPADELPQGVARLPLPPSTTPEWLTPVVAAPVIQRFALACAAHRCVDVDHPFGLTKVTRTY